jgi:hypothetical protein
VKHEGFFMSDQISCTACERKFLLGQVAPGQAVRCPYCQMTVEVPAPPSEESTSAPWYVYTFEGERYGPVTRDELDEWVRENRLTADCQVLQEGWPDWRWARDVFPALRASADLSLKKPVATVPPSPGGAGPAAHPYAAPRAPTGPLPPGALGPWTQPHRGGLILAFGILGLVVCQLFGLPAWIMGQSDLRAMRQGIIDPEGEAMTMAGMVLGIISTLVLGFFLLTGMFLLLAMR